jgi:hypothetical protein
VTSRAQGPIRVSMLRRVMVALAWLAAIGAAVALLFLGMGPSGLFRSAAWSVIFAALTVDVAAYASVGAILALRRPENVVGGLLMAAGLLLGLTFLGFMGGAILQVPGPTEFLAALAALVGGLTVSATLVVAGAAPALVFPDGHLPGRRWRWPVGALVIATLLSTVPNVVRPGPLGEEMPQNPFGIAGVPWIDALLSVADVFGALTIPAALAIAIVAVAVRFRRSRAAEREQLKWFVGANLLVATFLMLAIADGSGEPTLFDVLAVASLSLPPIAIGVAILRYHLYEIDRIISRTVSWGLVTGLLVVAFAGGVVALQAVLTGFTQGETLAVAASTLVVFALFQPVRRRVQAIVDRRFDRARYDAERTSVAFAGRLRDQVDMAAVTGDLAATVGSALSPTMLGLWLREAQR